MSIISLNVRITSMNKRTQIRKAVIPAAGLGTRFLPATKSVPKELLPIYDKPMIQFIIEEAVEAGIEDIIIITAKGKESIATYFHKNDILYSHLENTNDQNMLQIIDHVTSLANVSFVFQDKPLGLGHAVLMAEESIGSESFAVLLPDDIIANSPGALKQMVSVYNEYQCGIVAVEPIPSENIHNYGVVAASPLNPRVHTIQSLVEKPSRGTAPSNLCIVGRYILPPTIFQYLHETAPGSKQEIQLTDGLNLLLGMESLIAFEFEGSRYDGGSPLGLLKATLELGLTRPDTKSDIKQLLDSFL